jgi:hypothetical protein
VQQIAPGALGRFLASQVKLTLQGINGGLEQVC